MKNKCNQSTRCCENQKKRNMHYFELKKCCRGGLMTILNKIPYIFEGMDWWLEFGTLLGFIRDGKIIDWDDDLDVGIMKESLTPENIEKIKKRSEEFGFFFEGIKENHLSRIYYSKMNSLHCDIWTFEKNKDNIIDAISPWTPAIHEESFTKNKDTLIINDKTYNIPSDVHEFLNIRYGYWQNPMRQKRSYRDGRLHIPKYIKDLDIKKINDPTIFKNPPEHKY